MAELRIAEIRMQGEGFGWDGRTAGGRRRWPRRARGRRTARETWWRRQLRGVMRKDAVPSLGTETEGMTALR